MNIIIRKIGLLIFILSFSTLYSQSDSFNKDELQLKVIINSIEQGIKQHKVDYIINHVDLINIELSDKFLTRDELKSTIQLFYTKSDNRKLHKDWQSKVPSVSSPANWDFEITKNTIMIKEDLATINLEFRWISDLTFDSNQSISELLSPASEISDTWYFRKNGPEWKLFKTNRFLNIVESINAITAEKKE